MKKIILILAVAFLSSATFAQKYGHLNAQDLLKGMAEYKSAQTEMETYGTQKSKELEMMEADFKTEVEKYQKEAATLSDEFKKYREEDLGKKQQNIQETDTKLKKQFRIKNLNYLIQ